MNKDDLTLTHITNTNPISDDVRRHKIQASLTQNKEMSRVFLAVHIQKYVTAPQLKKEMGKQMKRPFALSSIKYRLNTLTALGLLMKAPFDELPEFLEEDQLEFVQEKHDEAMETVPTPFKANASFERTIYYWISEEYAEFFIPFVYEKVLKLGKLEVTKE